LGLIGQVNKTKGADEKCPVLRSPIVLCLDGVLFPIIAFGVSPEFVEIIAGGGKCKFIVATAFSIQ
jgi:hypothetical protein